MNFQSKLASDDHREIAMFRAKARIASVPEQEENKSYVQWEVTKTEAYPKQKNGVYSGKTTCDVAAKSLIK